jgi:hypothetical protein
VLGLDVVGSELLVGEVLQVERDDALGPRTDGSGEDVSVVGVREVETFDKSVEAP